ncbi:MAG: hypothetical protein WAK93_17065 [Solirubrobacteraceae bacterium]
MRALRPLLVVIAVAACVWFVLGIRQAHEVDYATKVVGEPHPGAAQLAKARSELGRAAFLNPDRQVDVLRGQVDFNAHQPQAARTVLSDVIRAEPMNLNGWIWYTVMYLGRPEQRIGAAHIAQLDPIDAKHLTP